MSYNKNKFWAGIVILLSMSAVNAETIVTDSTTRSETTVKSPPPTAIAPTINSMNNDLCAVGASGAVQTQILGISFGQVTRDMNCERLKLSKTLYDMGMKVAAVSVMCQDERVFEAMMEAGTPCPADGKIGAEARTVWEKRGKTVAAIQDAPAATEVREIPAKP